MEYKKRMADTLLSDNLEAFGAVLIGLSFEVVFLHEIAIMKQSAARATETYQYNIVI